MYALSHGEWAYLCTESTGMYCGNLGKGNVSLFGYNEGYEEIGMRAGEDT